jgi:hypothetical protein
MLVWFYTLVLQIFCGLICVYKYVHGVHKDHGFLTDLFHMFQYMFMNCDQCKQHPASKVKKRVETIPFPFLFPFFSLLPLSSYERVPYKWRENFQRKMSSKE